jgi:uncharacterized protein YciW
MAVDAQRLQDVTQFAQQLWSAPFQIVICMISLYQLVGWSMMVITINQLRHDFRKGLAHIE